jgi:hypothetical protein
VFVLIENVVQFLFGLIFALFLPRLPLMVLPRLSVMEGQLAPFPMPQPIDKHLISQMLIMSTLWKLSFLFALIPLAIGYVILISFATPIAFGLFIGAGWAILSRLIPTSGFSFPNTPYSTELIHELNEIRVNEPTCCDSAEIAWETISVRCQNCRTSHLDTARPDLGRIRTDGLLGRFRLLFLDGHPLINNTSED